MKSRCQRIQELLAERGAAALRDEPEAEAHIADCEACFVLLESIARLDEALHQLPVHEPPQSVVDELLATPELTHAPPSPVEPAARIVDFDRWKARLSPALRSPAFRAAAALVVVAGGAWLVLPAQREAPLIDVAPAATQEELRQNELKARGYLDGDGNAVDPTGPEAGGPIRGEDEADLQEIVVTSESPPDPWSVVEQEAGALVDRIHSGTNEEGRRATFSSAGDTGVEKTSEIAQPEPLDLAAYGHSIALGSSEAEATRRSKDDEGAQKKKETAKGALETERLASRIDASSAAAFLLERERVDGLDFVPARGYWANTYVPGDPRLRVLASRLAGWDRTALAQLIGGSPALHEDSTRPLQTAGDPRGAALSLQLDSDRVAARGPRRALLRVGLTATQRHGARRAATNLSLVLDIADQLEAETAAALRALLLSFAAAREPEDRFELWLAGHDGPIVAAADFRRGVVATRLDEILERPDIHELDGGHSLPTTLANAIAATFDGDDPSAVLGSSGVILVTSGSLAPTLPELERIAHKSALGGIPINAVGLGTSASPQELERLVLAGQGQRRWLEAASEAARLVDETLAFSGRAVARAARLNIRLAPGVRLVEVIGSERLDADAAQRVRAGEQSLDRRLARNLGIAADRGEDEDGIQIVIPSLYSGDRHAIFLDVVAPGPGPVAEVSLKYKDLVRLTNAESRVQLALDADDREGGELQREVLRGLLAERLAAALEQAGDALVASDAEAALAALAGHRRLLAELAVERPQLARDEVLDADRALLDSYRTVLQSEAASNAELRPRLVDSLHYASLLKTHAPWPRP